MKLIKKTNLNLIQTCAQFYEDINYINQNHWSIMNIRLHLDIPVKTDANYCPVIAADDVICFK